MLFEVFLVYYAREHTEIPATRIVNIARKVYEHLEDEEPVVNPGEKLENVVDKPILWQHNPDQKTIYKATLTEIDSSNVFFEPNAFNPTSSIPNELKEESIEWTGQLRKYLEKEMEDLSLNSDLQGQVTVNHYPFDSQKSYGFTIDFYNPTDAKIFQSQVKDIIKNLGYFTQSDMWALLGGKYEDWTSCHFGWKNSDVVADIKTITIPLMNKEYYQITLPASYLL